MTKQQEIALSHPCYLGGETAHPRFCYLVFGMPVSIVLSVNAGYE